MRYQSINWKHVLVFMLVIAIAFSGYYTFFPDLLYGIAKIYESAGKQDVAEGYYDKILQIDPKSPFVATTTHRKFLKILSSKDFKLMTGLVYISSNGSGMSGSRIPKEDLEKLNHQYTKAMQSTIDKDLKLKLSLDTALLNWFGGDYLKSLELLKQKSESNDVILLDYQRLFLSCIYLLMGQVEEVPSLINEQNIHTYHPSLQQKALATLDYYYTLLGNRDKFQQYTKEDTLNTCVPIPSEYKIYTSLLDIEETARDLWRVTEKSKNRGKYQGAINGRMVIENKAFPYQMLILKAQDDHTFSSYPWTEDSIGIAITDEEGRFSFENVPEGVYYIATYVPWPLVKEKNFQIEDSRFIDLAHHTKQTVNIAFEPKLSIKTVMPSEDHTKITFAFDKVEGADYYILAMGEVDTENQGENVTYTFYSEPFTTNHITIDVNQYCGKKSGGTSWDQKGINPYHVFGAFYHQGEYTYKITAYNHLGILGDNFGIWPNSKYPTIFVPGAQYTVADSLLLEQSYDKAIQAYDEALKKNPNDSHALQMLSRLYTLGYKAPYFDGEKNTGVDITKAIDYTERLLALTSDEEHKQSLAHLYMQKKAYDKALFYFQQVKKKDYFVYTAIARIYELQGNFDKAVENYYNSLKETDHAVAKLLSIELLRGNFDRLVPIAKLYQQRYEYIDYTELITAFLKHIEGFYDQDVHTLLATGKVKEAKKVLEAKKDDLSIFYKTLIILIEDNNREIRKEEYTTSYHKMVSKLTEAHPLVRLLKVFGKENFGSNFGKKDDHERSL